MSQDFVRGLLVVGLITLALAALGPKEAIADPGEQGGRNFANGSYASSAEALGGSVDIRIRSNGGGASPSVSRPQSRSDMPAPFKR